MARKRDRIFALVMALAFLVTTVGVSVAIILQMVQDNKTENTVTDQSQQATNKLEGTQMDNFTPVPKVDQLQIVDTEPGTGAEVKETDTVTVDYTGAVAATGKVFQSSIDFGQPVSFALNEVITGWKEGLVGMKQGGKRRLLIPADKAYGATPPAGSGIPANADLVFDITLHKIGK